MKISNPFLLSRPVEFVCRGTLASATSLLGRNVEVPKMQIKLEEALVGKVAPGGVEIWCHKPFGRNVLTPTFVGEFKESEGGVVLSGCFVVHKYVKACFTSALLGIVVSWAYIATRDEGLLGPQSEMVPFWFCLGNIAFAILLLYSFIPLFSAESEVMEKKIRGILQIDEN